MAELLTIETFGFKFFEQKISASQQRAINSSPAMRLVSAYLMEITEERFHREGPGWKPLSDQWAKRKATLGLDRHILRAKEGTPLMSSVTVPGAEGQILVITNNNIDYGSNLPYARAMQFGYPPRKIPARPYIGATPAQREVISEIIGRYLFAPMISADPVTLRSGDFTTGRIKGKMVTGVITDIPQGGGLVIRGPGGQFAGIYKD